MDGALRGLMGCGSDVDGQDGMGIYSYWLGALSLSNVRYGYVYLVSGELAHGCGLVEASGLVPL
jgi:hypothetical protein